jgi:hypothetical protein
MDEATARTPHLLFVFDYSNWINFITQITLKGWRYKNAAGVPLAAFLYLH